MLRWSFAITVLLCTAVIAAFGGDQSPPAWKAGEPAVKAKVETLRSTAKLDKDSVVLRNRGIIVTTDEYENADLSLTWKWEGGKEEGALQDVLAIVLLTDGVQRPWSHEIRNGVAIQFAAPDSKVFVRRYISDQHSPVLLAEKADIAFEKNKEYKLRVRFEKGKVEVFVGGGQKPLVTADIPPITNGRLAVYNREPVSGVVQQSTVTNLDLSGTKKTQKK